MNKEINILMVDDHPMIIEGYKDSLAHIAHARTGDEPEIRFTIDTAYDCDLAWDKITAADYDIVFLDMSFQHKPNSRFISGEDLGVEIREKYPQIKIIILTQIEDAFHLKNLMEKIRPEGFLLKWETKPEILESCVKSVLDAVPYFSPKISRILQSSTTDKFKLTENDRIILHQLSLGTKTKDIHNHVPLSSRAVENRKKRLKEYFGANDNEGLLAKARECGYI